jgi:regulatory protein YycH of two-component signal transduction system YycFG
MNTHIQQYISNGYTSIHVNTSNIGGQVLTNGNRIVKIGQDSAYDEYINFVQIQTTPLGCFPVIYNHMLHQGPFSFSSNKAYTVTEMEILQSLSQSDGLAYEAWIKANIAIIGNGGNAASDPFRLEQGIQLLITNAQAKTIGLDLLKSDNIMQRKSVEYVIIDPYN